MIQFDFLVSACNILRSKLMIKVKGSTTLNEYKVIYR